MSGAAPGRWWASACSKACTTLGSVSTQMARALSPWRKALRPRPERTQWSAAAPSGRFGGDGEEGGPRVCRSGKRGRCTVKQVEVSAGEANPSADGFQYKSAQGLLERKQKPTQEMWETCLPWGHYWNDEKKILNTSIEYRGQILE